MFLRKGRIIIQRCQFKKNVNILKGSWRNCLTKKQPHFSNYALLTEIQYILGLLQTIIRTILVTYSAQFLHWNCLISLWSTSPVILSSCVDYFCLSLPLLTGVTHFNHTSVFGLLIRICNRKGTERMFLRTETVIYCK